MDAELLAAVAAGSAWAGFLLGRRWADVRVRLARWGVVDSGRRPALKRRFEVAREPAPVVIEYGAWDACLYSFAKAAARLELTSERAILSAGIVASARHYRTIAPYMTLAGLWTAPGAAGQKRYWTDRVRGRAVAELRGRLADGMTLPYPPGKPPPVLG